MKKIYRTILLLLMFTFLSTYNPKNLNLASEKNNILFQIQKIEILNNLLVEKNEIEKKLEEIYNKNIFLIKRSDIEQPLKEIDFLEKVEVKKKYPNTVIVKIFETKPVAIVFKNKIKYLLDTSSNLVLFDKNRDFNNLPTVFGEGAENNFIYFLNLLINNQFPSAKIRNFYYFQIGRWDLELADNKIIKFPDSNIDEAIKKSIELLKREDFKNYNIIDLRVNGKIIVE